MRKYKTQQTQSFGYEVKTSPGIRDELKNIKGVIAV